MNSIGTAPRVLAVLIVGLLSGCQSSHPDHQSQFSYFVALKKFAGFTNSKNQSGETVLLSPVVNSPIPWNQLVVSWNATVPQGGFLEVEAAAIFKGRPTKFYTLAKWSPENTFSRTSVRGQDDAEGTVNTDTLVLRRIADSLQIRVTLGGASTARPSLKFLGLCFANTAIRPVAHPANHLAWGKAIPTPERSQYGYGNEQGWCSPTSLSMVLSRWAKILQRPELDLTVPQVAASVYDQDFGGTGNWPFNTAFAGSFKGMRAYVTRLDDLSEVEDWIAAGIPVILSARWDWLEPGRPIDSEGHLIVCVGFTHDGDVIVNDPAARLPQGAVVRRAYKRQNVAHAWTKSHNTVYLVYPEGMKIPGARFGHWER